MEFYHYTCTHGRDDILKTGVLQPGPDGLLWVTDLDVPVRDALGLTSKILECDRTEHRFKINDPEGIIPYVEFRKQLPEELIFMLELVPGVMVRHWYISTIPRAADLAPLR